MHILIAALHRPSKPTGICRYAVNLANCLAEDGRVSRISLVIGAWQKEYFQSSFTLSSQKISLVCINVENSSLSRNTWFLFGLPKLAKSLCPDLVHFSFPLPFIRAFFSVPVVSTVHDLYPYEYPSNFGYPQVFFNQLFLSQCIRNSNSLTCVSNLTLEKLNSFFPAVCRQKEVVTIYNHVEFSHICPKPPQSLDVLPTQSSFILCVAQHRKNKNLDLLIQAYNHLLKNNDLGNTTKLVIVGSLGPKTENLLRLINNLSLNKSVLLISAINDNELCWLYQNCYLFVIPSCTEGFCLPLAEALHFSSRIVCSDIPIFREIGSSRCTYFSLNDDTVKNLSEAMIHSLKETTSKDSSLVRFSKSNSANQYISLYHKVLNQ